MTIGPERELRPNGARILIIDDDVELGQVLAEVLDSAGHRTEVATSGREGLAALRQQPADLVVCDVHMPGLDGFGVLKEIRADPQLATLPFVFLTSAADVRAGFASGADDYLIKPVSSAELLEAIAARLARLEATRKEADRRVGEVQRAVAALLPHELRTPLTTILGAARLLQELHRDLEPHEIDEMAGGIVKAAERLHRMTENYILYADLETSRLSGSALERLAGRAGAADVASAAMEAAARRERGRDLHCDVADVSVPLAPAYLRKMVAELVDNAFKFSPAGTDVSVTLATVAGRTRLEVRDHGHGLTQDQVGKLGAFQQFDRHRFEQQGSGIGLTLVRGIAEAASARFGITSAPGTGTTVRIEWPS